MRADQTSGGRRYIVMVVLSAFALRLAAGVARGEASFLQNGYTFYIDLARSFLDGHGMCYAPGDSCGQRMPLYPLLLAPFLAIDQLYRGVVVLQSAVGAATALVTLWIARTLVSPRAGVIAATAVALNPYTVVHDSALQDTAVGNLAVLLSIAALLRAGRSGEPRWWAIAGTALASTVMIAARFALAVPLALLVPLVTRRDHRAGAAALLALPVVVVLGAWVARNAVVVGAPVLTTESGEALFYAHNPFTFAHYPERSIDLTADEFPRLPQELQQRLEGQVSDVSRDRAYRDAAMAYIRDHPGGVLIGAVRKLWVVVSAQLTPAQEVVTQWAYRFVFVLVNVLAALGMWRERQRWREHAALLIWLTAFALTTGIYWAHTSHKSMIDPLLFIYAASAVAPRASQPTDE